ncbi:MAG TPA: addiction module protein [Phycisphaerae bacterium]|nr:addiction module protein [Phycisphaerae bacterium]
MNAETSLQHILSLPAEKRLEIVETIWDSIAAEPESLPISEAQRREIEARLEEYRRDPGIAIPWEQARARLRPCVDSQDHDSSASARRCSRRSAVV